MANTARRQTMASVVIGVALFTGRPGTASELPMSFLRHVHHADVSSKNPLVRSESMATRVPSGRLLAQSGSIGFLDNTRSAKRTMVDVSDVKCMQRRRSIA